MKKRLIALLLVLVTLTAYMPKANAAAPLWFIAVNDRIPMTMTEDTEPFYIDGVLYIPYSAFDVKPFGISIAYNAEKRETLTLFTRVKRLYYDLTEKTCEDKEGNVINVDVRFRNGILYIPADCADYFGIKIALLVNSSGYTILRFTNGGEAYGDDTFLARAEKNINHFVENYESGTSNPGDENPDVQQPDDGVTQDPGVEPSGYAYLAFCGDAVLEVSLKLLEEEGLRGAFFLTAEQIADNPVLVRQLYAAGNTIGVTVSRDETDVQTALDAANIALDKTVFRKTLLALVPAELEQEIAGYRVLTIPEQDDVPTEEVSDEEIPVSETEPEFTTQFLVVSEANIYNTIANLQLENIKILQLRENSPVA